MKKAAVFAGDFALRIVMIWALTMLIILPAVV